MTFKCQNLLTQYLVIRWHWQGPPLVMEWTSSLQENEGSMAYLLTNVSTLMEAHIAVLHASIHSVYSE